MIHDKKLLILGASKELISLVQRAQELGAYVIVTDSFTDRSISPTKNYADEAWDYSWTDVDLLAEVCRKHHVDGITSGYSENKIEYVIKLCRVLGLPCYINENQLEITRNKKKFKAECRKFGIPTVKEYGSIESVDAYPVIVKPVDCAGSIGVSIAQNEAQLKAAVQFAKSVSKDGDAIIEQYINATKVDLYYAVEDGKATAITTCDTLMSSENGLDYVIQNAWLYPHKYEQKLLEQVDSKFKDMFKSLGIKYGCVAISGFRLEDGSYVFFECGFRTEGGCQFEYSFRKGYMNFLDIFILHALFGNTKLLIRNADTIPELKLCTANFYIRRKAERINGFDIIKTWDECTYSDTMLEQPYNDQLRKSILQKAGMISIAETDGLKLKQLLDKAFQIIKLEDGDGESVIFDYPDTDVIANWWND